MKRILALILAFAMMSCLLASCLSDDDGLSATDGSGDRSDNTENGDGSGSNNEDDLKDDTADGDQADEEDNTQTENGGEPGKTEGEAPSEEEPDEDVKEEDKLSDGETKEEDPDAENPADEEQPSEDGIPMYPIENAVPSTGLKFTKNKDGQSYSLAGMGTCRDNIIVVPYEYLGLPVTKVSSRAFDGDVITNEITLPKTVKVIGDNAFSMMKGLRRINLSEGLEVIDHEAFCGCSMITEMKLPSTVKTIGAMAFAGCDFTSFEWPRVIPTMTVNVFLDCASLETVFIPSSVIQIQPAVFNYCKSLTRIEFEGTMEQWNSLPKGDEWDGRTPDYVIVCKDGTLQKSN